MKKLTILPLLFIMLVISSSESKAQKIYDFVSVDKVPEYPGGIKKFYEYLGQNIKYPAVAKANKTSGKVFLTFVVEESGSLTNVEVTRGLSKETDAEALRVFKASPKWKPGIVKGKPVRVKYNINVNFDVDGKAPADKSALKSNNHIKDPQFPGGQTKLYSYLAKTLKYPKIAQKNNVQGKVLLSFFVETDGSISAVEVVKSLSKETDAEALKAIKNAPKWIPGTDASGKPARIKYNLPINFTIS
ncbi:energy transducer TonB [Pedobacter aquatilis]|uniref:energy transducer TonB n=1 Tax=Pedobacter aquatilis TaxID=351343 RepID=UPI00292CFDAA|nr:energy transducer TonB [Pedobacter aquatilis]